MLAQIQKPSSPADSYKVDQTAFGEILLSHHVSDAALRFCLGRDHPRFRNMIKSTEKHPDIPPILKIEELS
jgi:hypothetical protein